MRKHAYRQRQYRPTIWIRQACTKVWVNEATQKFENIEEDEMGRDRVTFTCTECKAQHSSLRMAGGRPG